jgi:hypothetical protein
MPALCALANNFLKRRSENSRVIDPRQFCRIQSLFAVIA